MAILLNYCPSLFTPSQCQYTVRVTHVVESKKRNGWVQDSQKRKVQVTKDNFFPVPLGRNRKEIASSWFQDLAGSKPLVQLAKKVRRERI